MKAIRTGKLLLKLLFLILLSIIEPLETKIQQQKKALTCQLQSAQNQEDTL